MTVYFEANFDTIEDSYVNRERCLSVQCASHHSWFDSATTDVFRYWSDIRTHAHNFLIRAQTLKSCKLWIKKMSGRMNNVWRPPWVHYMASYQEDTTFWTKQQRTHMNHYSTVCHGNARHAIANSTRTARYKLSGNENSGCMSFQAKTVQGVCTQLHWAFYGGNTVVDNGRARVEFVLIFSNLLCSKPGLM